jgi:hypothetical protein
LIVAVAADILQPRQQIVFAVVDAKGRSRGVQVQSGQTRNVPLDTMSGPDKLLFRAPDQVREVSLSFELKDVPLP